MVVSMATAGRRIRRATLGLPSTLFVLTFCPEPVLPIAPWFPAALFEQLVGATRDLVMARGARKPSDRSRGTPRLGQLRARCGGDAIQRFWIPALARGRH